MVFQEHRVRRLTEQVEALMAANRECDTMRRRQEAFLAHLIEKYQAGCYSRSKAFSFAIIFKITSARSSDIF